MPITPRRLVSSYGSAMASSAAWLSAIVLVGAPVAWGTTPTRRQLVRRTERMEQREKRRIGRAQMAYSQTPTVPRIGKKKRFGDKLLVLKQLDRQATEVKARVQQREARQREAHRWRWREPGTLTDRERRQAARYVALAELHGHLADAEERRFAAALDTTLERALWLGGAIDVPVRAVSPRRLSQVDAYWKAARLLSGAERGSKERARSEGLLRRAKRLWSEETWRIDSTAGAYRSTQAMAMPAIPPEELASDDNSDAAPSGSPLSHHRIIVNSSKHANRSRNVLLKNLWHERRHILDFREVERLQCEADVLEDGPLAMTPETIEKRQALRRRARFLATDRRVLEYRAEYAAAERLSAVEIPHDIFHYWDRDIPDAAAYPPRLLNSAIVDGQLKGAAQAPGAQPPTPGSLNAASYVSYMAGHRQGLIEVSAHDSRGFIRGHAMSDPIFQELDETAERVTAGVKRGLRLHRAEPGPLVKTLPVDSVARGLGELASVLHYAKSRPLIFAWQWGYIVSFGTKELFKTPIGKLKRAFRAVVPVAARRRVRYATARLLSHRALDGIGKAIWRSRVRYTRRRGIDAWLAEQDAWPVGEPALERQIGRLDALVGASPVPRLKKIVANTAPLEPATEDRLRALPQAEAGGIVRRPRAD